MYLFYANRTKLQNVNNINLKFLNFKECLIKPKIISFNED